MSETPTPVAVPSNPPPQEMGPWLRRLWEAARDQERRLESLETRVRELEDTVADLEGTP